MTQEEEQFAEELQTKMDRLGLGSADDIDDEPEPTPEQDDTEEEEVEDDNDDVQADEGEGDDDPTPDEGDDEGEGGEDENDSGIPDALYRAAIHQGWKPDEIDEFVATSPELATRTFEKMYEATNKISAEFARFGRTKAQEGKGAQAQAKGDEGAADDKSDISLDELKEQYGEDSAIVKTFEAMLKAQPKAQQEAPAPAAPVVDEATRQMVSQFFTADAMKLYKDFYGEGADKNKLTYEQVGNRYKTLEMADYILAGAEAQGRKMDTAEALERAHLCVTESIRSDIIRKDIAAKVTKKAKGVSLKPSSPKKGQSKGKDGDSLEQIVSKKLQKVFRG